MSNLPFDLNAYWRNEGPPQTRIQKADYFIRCAYENTEEAFTDAPDEVWELIRTKVIKARENLDTITAQLRLNDGQWCDGCQRWKEDPLHRVNCEPDPNADDEYDRRREALQAGKVYGGAPAPSEGA